MSDQPPSNVQDLLARARVGDTEAFGEVCKVLEARLFKQAMLLCAEPSLAEDLAQDTLVEAWRCLGRYNGSCQFFTWLCAILQNHYRNVSRRKRFWSVCNLRFADRLDETPAPDEPRASEAWPDEAAQAREQALLVRRCVQSLPAKQQQVVYLRFFVDDSLESIAIALDCSIGTVKSRLFHALEKLRRMPALRAAGQPFDRTFNVL